MEESEELKAVTAQRDRLARYIFEEDGGALDEAHCRTEMKAGRCPFRSLPYEEERSIEVCAPCIVEMIGKGNPAPADPYFSLLATHRVLVVCHIIGGPLFTGRIVSVVGDAVTFLWNRRRKTYCLDKIDVLVPKEVLRWSGYKLNPTKW